MAKKTKGKQIATKQPTGTALDVSQYANLAGQGMEDADADSYAIPFLAILQSNSPQVKKTDGAYIKGAEEGMIFNTVTGELFQEVNVIPCYFKREIIEWVPRDDGGGFVGRHEVGSEPNYENVEGRWTMENGHQLNDTRMHFVLILSDGKYEPGLVSMTSTQIKKSRKWMTMLNQRKAKSGKKIFTPPTFTCKFELSTTPEKNEKGSWWGWNLKPTGDLLVNEGELFAAARDFHESVKSGAVQIAAPPASDSESEAF